MPDAEEPASPADEAMADAIEASPSMVTVSAPHEADSSKSEPILRERPQEIDVPSTSSSVVLPVVKTAPSALAAFPSRSSMNSGDSSSSPGRVNLRNAEQLQEAYSTVSRYATADLITTILRLDFWNDDDANSIFFCKSTLDAVVSQLGMPDKTVKSFKQKLQGETAANEDIATLITSIRDEDSVKAHGINELLGSLLLGFIGNGVYDARQRVLLRHLATLLGVLWDDFEEIEASLADTLMNEQYVESEQSRKVRERTARNKKIKRAVMIGAAGGVGGVLIGLTGGLAAPIVATAVGSIIGAAPVIIGSGAIMGSIFGVAGAGFTGYKMKKRVGAIEEFEIATLSEGTSLRCVLAISGWIDKDTPPELAYRQQWRHLEASAEQYTLQYESRYLAELGSAIDYLMSIAVSMAIQQTLLETALAGLVSAVAWPVALLGAASVLDNPWNVCVARSAEVGEHLAEVLLSRAHGKRPVTLIGFSLGARVIYHCLLTMSKRSDSQGIIEDVVLLGAPVTASGKQWAQIASIVGGRIINGYCETDWLLRFVYRTMSVQPTIAGTSPVGGRSNKKIVNYNLSHIVKGHLDYSRKLTQVLSAVGLKVSRLSEASMLDLARELSDARAVEKANAIPGNKENMENSALSENSSVQSNRLDFVHFDIGTPVKEKSTD